MTKETNELLKRYRSRIEAHSAQWDAAIERCRKADATVRVVDKNGRPAAGVRIAARQKTHDFFFGCNGLQIGQKGAQNGEYERAFTRLFNLVTSTCCWSVTEPREGFFRLTEADGDEFRRPPMQRILDFGKSHGLAVKFQPLMADSWRPDWASQNAAELWAQWTRFIEALAERYGGAADVWDVVNEAQLCRARTPGFPLWNKELDYVDQCFETAGRVFGARRGIFEINEGTQANWGEPARLYERQIRRLLEKKLPLDQIGLQFHQFSGAEGLAHLRDEHTPIDAVCETVQRLGALGLPLAITEVTVASALPGMSRSEGEAVQAEVACDLYRMWFAQPQIHTVTWWNLMDGTHWKNEGDCRGCLLDADMREKPVYQALYQLLRRQWMTSVQLETDARGEGAFRGFRGTYELIVDGACGHRVCTMDVRGAAEPLTITI